MAELPADYISRGIRYTVIADSAPASLIAQLQSPGASQSHSTFLTASLKLCSTFTGIYLYVVKL